MQQSFWCTAVASLRIRQTKETNVAVQEKQQGLISTVEIEEKI